MSITPFTDETLFPDLPRGMLDITCRNHPTARYSMKNIPGRTLHFLHWADEAGEMEMDERIEAGWVGPANLECPCPSSDLIIVDDGRQVFGAR